MTFKRAAGRKATDQLAEDFGDLELADFYSDDDGDGSGVDESDGSDSENDGVGATAVAGSIHGVGGHKEDDDSDHLTSVFLGEDDFDLRDNGDSSGEDDDPSVLGRTRSGPAIPGKANPKTLSESGPSSLPTSIAIPGNSRRQRQADVFDPRKKRISEEDENLSRLVGSSALAFNAAAGTAPTSKHAFLATLARAKRASESDFFDPNA